MFNFLKAATSPRSASQVSLTNKSRTQDEPKQVPINIAATAVAGSEAQETFSASTDVSSHYSQPSVAIVAPTLHVEPAATPTEPQDTPLPESPQALVPLAALDSEHLTPVYPDVKPSPAQARRFSFRSFTLFYSRSETKPALSADQEREKKIRASVARIERTVKPVSSSSNKRAKESALVVRSLIVGGATGAALAGVKSVKSVSKPELSKVKAQLMQPKSANKVIAQLRSMPASDLPAAPKSEGISQVDTAKPHGPIHAVCLDKTEVEAHEHHFSRLNPVSQDSPSNELAGVATATLNSISTVFNDMHLVSLITAPDLGLGQAGDGEGLLAGAVPTAETVINGIVQITPQLMALGYATGKAVLPDHTGVHPPTDRISVLTYWWGLEVVLPPPTLRYLDNADSISTEIINFLTALSVINNGVREILPFIRYIGQFIDFEYKSIKNTDQGSGVVCAATWMMPAAMVPRAWDFSPPEQVSTPPGDAPAEVDPAPAEPPAQLNPSSMDSARSDGTSSGESQMQSDSPSPIPSSPGVLPALIISPPMSTENIISSDAHLEPAAI